MHSTSLHNQNLGEVGKYWVLCIRLCVRQIIVMCEIWKICYIVYMCEWYSPATRQHDLQQRWWRKSFFVQLIWALGEWNYVMPCSNISTSFSRLLQFRNSVRATDNFFVRTMVQGRWWRVQFRFLVGPVWSGCSCGWSGPCGAAEVWGLMRLVVFTPVSKLTHPPFSFSLPSILFYLPPSDRKEGNGTITQSNTTPCVETLHSNMSSSMCMQTTLQETTKVHVLSVHYTKDIDWFKHVMTGHEQKKGKKG